MPSISRMACCSEPRADTRSSRWLERKASRLLSSACSSTASALTGPMASSALTIRAASISSASRSRSSSGASASSSAIGRRHSVSIRSTMLWRRAAPWAISSSSRWYSSLEDSRWWRAVDSDCSVSASPASARGQLLLGIRRGGLQLEDGHPLLGPALVPVRLLDGERSRCRGPAAPSSVPRLSAAVIASAPACSAWWRRLVAASSREATCASWTCQWTRASRAASCSDSS